MGCSQPVVWKGVCRVCGKEICRFCSEPDENKIKAGERLEQDKLAYKNGAFSAHVEPFYDKHNDGPDAPCCLLENITIISEPWTNTDLFLFLTELATTCKNVTSAAKSIGQLRKFIQSGNISKESFDIMYTNLVAIMESVNCLANERYNIDYLKEDVSSEINF